MQKKIGDVYTLFAIIKPFFFDQKYHEPVNNLPTTWYRNFFQVLYRKLKNITF